MYKIMCITNRHLCRGDFLEQVKRIANAKPDGIILREKDLQRDEYEKLAVKVMAICKEQGVLCILHNYIDVAMKLGAVAIHLPMPRLRALTREQREAFQVLGASCHSVDEALEAQTLGCHYITASHIFATDCKKNVPPKGIPFLHEICETISIPVYALGGITINCVAEVVKTGAVGVCMMGNFMKEENPKEIVKSLKQKQVKEQLRVYAVTNRAGEETEKFYDQVRQAIRGGATCIQLREKEIDEAKLLEEAITLREICHSANVLFIVNDNVNVALQAGADGVHVGQEDGSVREIRELAGDQFVIGVTAKTVEQARQAYEDGADYLGVGAVFASSTKKDAKRITLEQLKAIADCVPIPSVAIGGITKENMDELRGADIAGLALVSAIFGAADIEEETRQIRKKIEMLYQHSDSCNS